MADNKAKTSPVRYVEQVMQEGRKVVWPTSRETVITTILVLILMVLFGIFFFFVDWIAANGTQLLLNIGTAKSSGSVGGG